MDTHQGITLDRYLAKRSPLEQAQAAKLMIQVAQQLGTAADSFLVHPGRILVQKDGSVRLLPPAAEDLALPAIVEYPAYAAPEEVRGGRPDVRSALYSIGCTLYEVLAGAPPYAGSDPKQVLHAHIEAPVPDVREKAPGVSATLAETVRSLLEKDPELRIQTPDELVRRLKQALTAAGVPVPRSPPAAVSSPPGPPKGAVGAGAQPPLPELAELPVSSPPGPPRGAVGARAKRALGPHGGEARHVSGTRAHAGHGHAAGRALAQAARHGPAAHRQGRRRGAEDEELEEEAPPAWAHKHSRPLPITIAGAVIGVLIGIYVVYAKVQDRKAQDLVQKAQTTAKLIKDEHQKRKDTYAASVDGRKKMVTDAMIFGKSRSKDERQDALVRSMDNLCDALTAPALADEIVKGWSSELVQAPEEIAAEDKAFEEIKAEALKLHGEGKLWKAIDKIREDEITHKARHGREIDDLVKRWSDELEAKWKEATIQADRLALGSEGEKAIEILRQAEVYGDYEIRKEASRRIENIQAQLTIQAGAGKAEAEGDDAQGGEAEGGGAEGMEKEAGGAGEEPAEPELEDPDKPAEPEEPKEPPEPEEPPGDDEK
ncbi:MAG: hypothetical protein HY721_13330 [Planctomycetes bacterium]|nr:hypothetical protein [Planctomycetota bacterium]